MISAIRGFTVPDTCLCGRSIHPAYQVDGLCEDCLADGGNEIMPPARSPSASCRRLSRLRERLTDAERAVYEKPQRKKCTLKRD